MVDLPSLDDIGHAITDPVVKVENQIAEALSQVVKMFTDFINDIVKRVQRILSDYWHIYGWPIICFWVIVGALVVSYIFQCLEGTRDPVEDIGQVSKLAMMGV